MSKQMWAHVSIPSAHSSISDRIRIRDYDVYTCNICNALLVEGWGGLGLGDFPRHTEYSKYQSTFPYGISLLVQPHLPLARARPRARARDRDRDRARIGLGIGLGLGGLGTLSLPYGICLLVHPRLSLARVYPAWHEQLKEPIVFLQICSQAWLSSEHSLISVVQWIHGNDYSTINISPYHS